MKSKEHVRPVNRSRPAPAASQTKPVSPAKHLPPHVQQVLSLQKMVGNRASLNIIQRADPPSTQAPTPKRKNYVFIMGRDRKGTRNPFYGTALRYYSAKISDAIIQTKIRTLSGLLAWVRDNVTDPIGNIYIVTHGYEDGTVSFGLNTKDKDKKVGVVELRNALYPAKGQSKLPQLGKQIDKNTRIHIKGCNIGRSQAMVELVDAAFGGAGVVIAPTHEQEYGFRNKPINAMKKKLIKEVKDRHPLPKKVDPSLRGSARRNALRERRRALNRRKQAIKAELKRRKAEHKRKADRAGMYQTFTGPLFQRPGSKLYSKAEMTVLVNGLYSHLSVKRRAALVKGLIKRDPRSYATAKKNHTRGQQGQRVYRSNFYSGQYDNPQNKKELRRIVLKTIRKFKPQALRGIKNKDLKVIQTGRHIKVVGKGGKLKGVIESDLDPIPSDATYLKEGKKLLGNPGNYKYRITRKTKRGVTYVNVSCERVIAYMHHANLSVSSSKPLTASTSDKKFYATSTYTPKK